MQRALYAVDFALFTSMLWLLQRLGVDRSSRLGAWLGSTLGQRFGKTSRALAENLRIAFPDTEPLERAAYVREAWANAGAVFGEYVHLEQIASAASGRVEVHAHETVRAIAARGEPAIFVTAHLANWEIAGAAIARLNLPLTCVYSPPTNPLLDKVLRQWRGRLGMELIAREESMRPMLRALSQGRSLGIVMDRRVDSGKPIMLFGHEKPTTLIPARLALRHGYPMVPLRIERVGAARFRATFHEPIAALAGGDEVGSATRMTAEVHRLFEAWIRARPGDWFPSKRLWPKARYKDSPHHHNAASSA